MSISVRNVTKLYGQQKALNDVSFEIGGKEVVGFLGPNGAGKSTMMKVLTCYIPQTSGEASVCGFDVREDSLEVRRRVGYLPEHNPLYTEMYVREYLEFVGGIFKLGNKLARVKEMIGMAGCLTDLGVRAFRARTRTRTRTRNARPAEPIGTHVLRPRPA